MSKTTQHIISLPSLDRIFLSAGCVPSDTDALKALGSILEEAGVELANNAWDLAVHAGRLTLQDEDLKLAYNNWRAKGRE